jgi:GNAT superfamily N-acetyltransferase
MSQPPIRIRRVTDLAACIDALRAVHEADGYPVNWPADPHRWLSPSRLLRAWIVEEPEGTVAGHVAVHRLPPTVASDRRTSARHVELARLFVTPIARRRSLATALVARVRSWAAENRYGLTLNVTDECRSAAVAFYEATGWRHSHTTDADWATPDGRPMKLRHYVLAVGTSETDGSHADGTSSQAVRP